ncbi:MAG: hypothetical protein ACRDI1_04180 [Actinomycetota bacterium]
MFPRRPVIAGVALIVALLVGAFVFFRTRGDGSLFKEPEPPARARVKFTLARPVDPLDRPEAEQTAKQETEKIGTLLNRLYTLALLRPERWSGDEAQSAEQDLGRFFTAEARDSIPDNLEALTLGRIAARLERVDPTLQEGRISFTIEPDLTASLAVITVTVKATGKARESEDDPVEIVHEGTYWAVPEGNSYKILAYAVEQKADTPRKEARAAFGAPK